MGGGHISFGFHLSDHFSANHFSRLSVMAYSRLSEQRLNGRLRPEYRLLKAHPAKDYSTEEDTTAIEVVLYLIFNTVSGLKSGVQLSLAYFA